MDTYKHEARFFLLENLDSSREFQRIPPEKVSNIYFTLYGDFSTYFTIYEDANVNMLREQWQKIIEADPFKKDLLSTHYLVVDIGVSKIHGGLGASRRFVKLLMHKPDSAQA